MCDNILVPAILFIYYRQSVISLLVELENVGKQQQ